MAPDGEQTVWYWKGFDMPLVEILLIEVGPAIAKSILKLWLKDSTIGQDVSSTLIDLLKSWTSDASAQRKGKKI